MLALVERCALAKRRLVLLDEHDRTGIRIALNLGHTLSHALEAATRYRLRHGEAVAYGLRAALGIGGDRRDPGCRPDARRACSMRDLGADPLDAPLDVVLGYIASDRKRRGGRVRWVLVGRRRRDPRRRPCNAGAGGGNVLAGRTRRSAAGVTGVSAMASEPAAG